MDSMEQKFLENEGRMLNEWPIAKQTLQYEIDALHHENSKLHELHQAVELIVQIDDSVRRIVSQGIGELLERARVLCSKNDTMERENNSYHRAVHFVSEIKLLRTGRSEELTSDQLAYIRRTPYPHIAMPIDDVLSHQEKFYVRACKSALASGWREQRPQQKVLKETLAHLTRDRLVAFLFYYGDITCVYDLRVLARSGVWSRLDDVPRSVIKNTKAFAVFKRYDWSGLASVTDSVVNVILDLFELRRWHFIENCTG